MAGVLVVDAWTHGEQAPSEADEGGTYASLVARIAGEDGSVDGRRVVGAAIACFC